MYKVVGATIEEYDDAIRNGESAEMNVFSVTRGGWYYNGRFFYTAGRYLFKCEPESGCLKVKVLA